MYMQMTLSIIGAFIGCWTPYFVVHLIHIWSEYSYSIPDSVYAFAETLALFNSAINPVLYGCFNYNNSNDNSTTTTTMTTATTTKMQRQRQQQQQCYQPGTVRLLQRSSETRARWGLLSHACTTTGTYSFSIACYSPNFITRLSRYISVTQAFQTVATCRDGLKKFRDKSETSPFASL